MNKRQAMSQAGRMFLIQLMCAAALGVPVRTAQAACCPADGPLRILAFSPTRLGDPQFGFCSGTILDEARRAIGEVVAEGFTCEEVDVITRGSLVGADVFIAVPSDVRGDVLSSDEQRDLAEFLATGGNLVVVGENSLYRSWLNSIGAVVGFTFADTMDFVVEILRHVDHCVLNGPAGRVTRLRVMGCGGMSDIPPGSIVLGLEFHARFPALVAQDPDEGSGCGAVVIWPDFNAIITWYPPAGSAHMLDADNRKLVGNTIAWINHVRRGEDIEPPRITATSRMDRVWPPNHRFVELTLGKELITTVTDNCDADPSVRIVDARSNEPSDSVGDGRFRPDLTFDDNSVRLRAERMGPRAGRTYTITLEARDRSGNTSQADLEVVVPHDQRNR